MDTAEDSRLTKGLMRRHCLVVYLRNKFRLYFVDKGHLLKDFKQ